MTKPLIVLIAAGATLAATPTLAGYRQGDPVYDDSNSRYLDYRTDLSEARRELRKDLTHADSPADRIDAWSEYRREVADARHDFAKEMAERGVDVRRAVVTVEEGE